MLRRIGFARALAQAGLPQPGSNGGLDPVTVLQSFLLSVWTGVVRFAHTAAVRFDPVLRALFSLEAVPAVPSVLSFTRFFRRFGKSKGIWFLGA